jgi:hypothetical protein
VLEKLVLFGILAAAAYGAARLVPSERIAARVGAGLLYAWSPYTYERILLGHWALLVGYAALPWVAGAAVALREKRPRGWPRLVLAMAAAVAGGPYTGVLSGLLALAVTCLPPGGRARRALVLAMVVFALNLPWLVPAVLGPAAPGNPVLGSALFRARSDSPLGTVGSLLSLGGLWRTDLAPPGRQAGVWIPAFLIIGGLSMIGLRELRRRWPPGAWTGLLIVAGAGLVLAASPGITGPATMSRWLARLPGGGIVRDSQKFVMPYALALSVGFGLGLERIARAASSSGRWLRRSVSAMAILPVALAPTLAWGGSGRLFTASYPASWSLVETITSGDPQPGGVLVLPWHAYLPLRWNGERTVHQPALQYFSRPVLASSALEVGAYRLPEEDPWARRAAPTVLGRESLVSSLKGLGVRYVLVFKEADWRTDLPRVIGLAPILDTSDLRLYRTQPARVPAFPRPAALPVVLGDLLAAAVVLAAGWRAARPSRFPSGPALDILPIAEGGHS